MHPRIGLIGLGGISHAHGEGYRRAADRAEVTAVCDLDARRAAERASAFGDAQAFTDSEELFSSGLVDAVDIMLPHSLHEQVAGAAMAHGLHVLLEKPATPTADGYDRLLELARRQGVLLAVAENTQYVAAYVAAKQLIDEGVLGEIQYVRTLIAGNESERLSQPALWKGRRDGTVGGVILDAGAHSFYLLSWFFGAVRDLTATSWRKVHESEVEDVAVVAGQLVTGAQFTTEYTFTAQIPWTERAEIYGSAGSVIVDQLCDPVAKVYADKRDFYGTPLPGVPYDPGNWKRDSIAAEVVDFVTALAEGRSTSVSPVHVRNGLIAIEAAYGAAASNRQTPLPVR